MMREDTDWQWWERLIDTPAVDSDTPVYSSTKEAKEKRKFASVGMYLSLGLSPNWSMG